MAESNDLAARVALLSRTFTPASPVSESDLFAGRMPQLHAVVEAIVQPGQHAAVFGERGVGKTSLANILASRLVAPGQRVIAPKVNCDSTDDFTSLWKKVFSQIDLTLRNPQPGFQYTFFEETTRAADVITDAISPDGVRRLLAAWETAGILVIILDEFDRLSSASTKRAIADTIKMLSDTAVNATILIVGVADSISALIAEHQSIERALVQVQMPRMSPEELAEVIEKGLTKLGMAIEERAKAQIVRLSRGLPHYTHLLSLHATKAAIESESTTVTGAHIDVAIATALEGVSHSLRSAYDRAVFSPQQGTIFSQVLLACALAETGEFGYFTAAAVRDPLSQIMHRRYDIPAFASHLNNFCAPERAAILQKQGAKRKFRFRFANPLMQPFIVMKGVASRAVSQELLERFGR